MSAPIELVRDRNVGQLVEDALRIYRHNLGTLLLLAAGVVIPVELAISGFGLGQLTSGYDASPSAAETIVQVAVAALLITPLLTAMVVNVVVDAASGTAASAARAATAGLDVFAPMLAAVLLVSAGVALGFVALFVPGVILAVHWVVVPQAVVVEGRRGVAALAHSAALVRGNAWWVLGVLIVTNVAASVAGALLSVPIDAVARAADAQAVSLAATMIAEIFTLPFIAVTGTLVFFTLKARGRAHTS